jgi:curli production assembly/transport component CsgG
MFSPRCFSAALLALLASGCVSEPLANVISQSERPTIGVVSPTQKELNALPGPVAPVPVAVYNYTDQTGQLKPSENFQSLSRAVSQGTTSMLIHALRDAGGGTWFTVVERERLDNLLKERQIIREMRARYLGEQFTPPQVLPSLLFAGVLLEGGVIGFDANTVTGGLGARYLGIGGSTEYRQNTVTVYLRAVSVRTGEVIADVQAHKTVASTALNSNVFKFVTFDELLEVDTGITSNEPSMIALKEAVEKAVYAMIFEGAQEGLWGFADPAAAQPFIEQYYADKQRMFDAVKAPLEHRGGPLHQGRRRGGDRAEASPIPLRAPHQTRDTVRLGAARSSPPADGIAQILQPQDG